MRCFALFIFGHAGILQGDLQLEQKLKYAQTQYPSCMVHGDARDCSCCTSTPRETSRPARSRARSVPCTLVRVLMCTGTCSSVTECGDVRRRPTARVVMATEVGTVAAAYMFHSAERCSACTILQNGTLPFYRMVAFCTLCHLLVTHSVERYSHSVERYSRSVKWVHSVPWKSCEFTILQSGAPFCRMGDRSAER